MWVRENRLGLADAVLTGGDPRGEAPSDDAQDGAILHLFHGSRTGYVIVLGSDVIEMTPDRSRFEASLRDAVIGLLMRRCSSSVLVPGVLAESDAGAPALELRPRIRLSGDAEDVPGTAGPVDLLLLVDAGLTTRGDPRSIAGLRFVDASQPDPGWITLRNMESPKGPERLLDLDAAIPWIASLPIHYGAAPEAGLDLVLGLARRCSGFRAIGLPRANELDGRTAGPRLGQDSLRIGPDGNPRPCADSEGSTPAPSVFRDGLDVWAAMLPWVLLRVIAPGTWVAVNPRANTPLILDDQAAAVLGLLDGETPASEIVSVATELFAEPAREIEERLLRLFEQLARYGIVTDARSLPSASAAEGNGPASPATLAGEAAREIGGAS